MWEEGQKSRGGKEQDRKERKSEKLYTRGEERFREEAAGVEAEWSVWGWGNERRERQRGVVKDWLEV